MEVFINFDEITSSFFTNTYEPIKKCSFERNSLRLFIALSLVPGFSNILLLNKHI